MTYLPFKQIQTKPSGNGTVIVTEAYSYKDINIEVGFESDGATIPRFLWWLYPPFYPNYLTACVVHDYLCKAESYKKADRYFQQILKQSGVRYTTRRNLVLGVKTWHNLAYKDDNQPRGWLSLLLKRGA